MIIKTGIPFAFAIIIYAAYRALEDGFDWKWYGSVNSFYLHLKIWSSEKAVFMSYLTVQTLSVKSHLWDF